MLEQLGKEKYMRLGFYMLEKIRVGMQYPFLFLFLLSFFLYKKAMEH